MTVTGRIIFLVILLLLTGCNSLFDMSADTMRAAIDNCKDKKLGVLVYQRTDGSVMAIRCMPSSEDVTQSVTLRKRTPMPIIKLIYEKYEVDED
jgi:hypothetical protein